MVLCYLAQSFRFSIQVSAAIPNVRHEGGTVYNQGGGDGRSHIRALLLVPLMDSPIGSLHSIDQELPEIGLAQIAAPANPRQHSINQRLYSQAACLLTIHVPTHTVCCDKHPKGLWLSAM